MKKRRMKKNLWNAAVVLSMSLGVLGSLSAWETGNIGLGRMLVQVVIFALLSYCAAMMSANVGRTVRAVARPALLVERSILLPRATSSGHAA